MAYLKKKLVFLTLLQVQLLALANSYDRLVICNGCRPKWLSDNLPKKLDALLSPFFDLVFKAACGNHDVIYRIGGTEKDRKRADKYFKYEMNLALKKSVLYKSSKYKKLEKTKWYQIKWKNIKRGFYNIAPAFKNGGKATGYFIKKQYLKIKIFEYYMLVRKFGKDSFNFKDPITKVEQFPSFDKPIKSIIKYNPIFTYQGRIYLEKTHEKRMV